MHGKTNIKFNIPIVKKFQLPVFFMFMSKLEPNVSYFGSLLDTFRQI